MIEIKTINAAHSADANLPNEPFLILGRMILEYRDGRWSSREVEFPPEERREMCFPDEHYKLEEMSDTTFLGAYEDGKCVGVAVLQEAMFKYMYLLDLKVNRDCRGKNIGRRLIDCAKQLAAERGYRGIYTQGQNDNLGACRFYIRCGFRIGGLVTDVYMGTKQEGKSDIYFYLD